MSRNGSGTQTSPAGSFPAVGGTTIDSTKFNNVINDINSSLTASIANDGQTPILANLPMSGFKHTGAAAGSVAGEYVEYAQYTTALAAKAASGANTDITSLSAPALGAATATTAAVGDNDTSVATTAWVVNEFLNNQTLGAADNDPGHIKLPGGLLIEWGINASVGTSAGNLSVTLTQTFSKIYATFSQIYNGTGYVDCLTTLSTTQRVSTIRNASTAAITGSVNVFWVVIGKA